MTQPAPAAFEGPNIVADVDTLPGDPLVPATVRFLYDLRERLPMFVVYDHPADFPDHFVARLWVSVPQQMAFRFVLRARTLDALYDALEAFGLTHLSRQEGDAPEIIGSWL